MEFLRQQWTHARGYLEGMSRDKQVVILLVIVLMFVVVAILLYLLSGPERVLITKFAAGRSEEVMARLQSHGIDAERKGTQISVPRAQRDEAILLLVQDELLNDDVSDAFNDLVLESSSLWETKPQGDRKFLIARQMVLGRIIRRMKGVRTAQVLIDLPPKKGIGAAAISPSASVFISTGNRSGDQRMVEAVAALVSGAVADMEPTDVQIVINNRPFRVDDEDDVDPSRMMEFVRHRERDYTRKIRDLLGYITGVTVAVTVRVDPVQHRTDKEYSYLPTEPLQSEETEEILREDAADQGEPGTRANAMVAIPGSGGQSHKETINRERIDYYQKLLVSESFRKLAGHVVKQINVSIGVPRSFFIGLFKAQSPGQESEPTDADLRPIMEYQLAQIKAKVQTVTLADEKGEVRVDMIPDSNYVTRRLTLTPSSGIAAALESEWAKPVGIGLLAMLSLALMLGMVRKATRQEPLPLVEELAGVPPRLPSDEDLVGEVEETESSMAGLELQEEELKSRKIAEQISELIKSNPTESGGLLRRWVRTDE